MRRGAAQMGRSVAEGRARGKRRERRGPKGGRSTTSTMPTTSTTRARKAQGASGRWLLLREGIEDGNAHPRHVGHVPCDDSHSVDERRGGKQGVDGGSLASDPLRFAAQFSPREGNGPFDRKNAFFKSRENVVFEPLFQSRAPGRIAEFDETFRDFTDRDERKIERFRVLAPQPTDDLRVGTAVGKFADDARVEQLLHRATSRPKSVSLRETSSVSPSASFGHERSASTKFFFRRPAGEDGGGGTFGTSGTRIT